MIVTSLKKKKKSMMTTTMMVMMINDHAIHVCGVIQMQVYISKTVMCVKKCKYVCFDGSMFETYGGILSRIFSCVFVVDT